MQHAVYARQSIHMSAVYAVRAMIHIMLSLGLPSSRSSSSHPHTLALLHRSLPSLPICIHTCTSYTVGSIRTTLFAAGDGIDTMSVRVGRVVVAW